jgi:hypothetical protein
MRFLINFESNWSRDVQGVHKCARLIKGQSMRNDLGTSKSWKCVRGWQPPNCAIHKLSVDV